MAFEKLNKSLVRIFGSRNERVVKAYMTIAKQAGEFEEQTKALDDEQLTAKTGEFKAILANGRQPEDILLEAFAVVREAARRTLQERHYDVQLVGGNVLYEGKIAEMATGEGKTLASTLAAYLVYLTGRKVHIVTVNDYLANRDADWMGPIYQTLGLTVGAIQADMDTSGQKRKDQYNCDITYGTNNEFGFDYLRDNMKISLEQMAQGPLDYAIVDEVDSILIDEARTPLIISGPAFDDVSRYKKADTVCRKLIGLQSGHNQLKKQIDSAQRTIANAQGELAEAKKAKDSARMKKAQEVIEQTTRQLEADRSKLETTTQYYEVEHDRKAVHLTHEGIGAAQDIAGLGSFFTGSNMEWPHMLEQGLRAHVVFEREKEYVVLDGKVVIVDEFTGRLMHGRQWSDGLHQAVEAKENVQIKEETQTLATITLQNFFKLYGQIAGMTGTAATEAEEFMNIYNLDVVVIPTNEPCMRNDQDDMIYKTMKEKFSAILDEIYEASSAGRPVLVGTVSVEKNEAISAALTKKYAIDHELLNAKHHEREASIITKAGQQHRSRDGKIRGNITIATNMAGRGTDIKLGESVLYEVVNVEDNPSEKGVLVYTLKQSNTDNKISFKSTDPIANVFQIQKDQKWVGGLHVVGTERHEARRIDNQLRGRSGRQGDAGSSVFFLSFDDDLMEIFGGEKITKLLTLIGWEEGQPIFNPRISKQIAKVQKKVEERNFEIRKSLLEYDEVMDYQRKIFYSRRRKIIEGRDLNATITEMIESAIAANCANILNEDYPYNCIIEWARSNFGVDLKLNEVDGVPANEIEQLIKRVAKKNTANEISLSIGEYLEDYEDRSTWDIEGLRRWAMSAFGAGLSAGKLRHANPEEIEEILVTAANQQTDKKDCSQLDEFLEDDFAVKTFVQWAHAKFDIKLDVGQLEDLKVDDIRRRLGDTMAQRYREREIAYPVEFAMNMVFGPQGPNVYGFEALAEWANKKYSAGLSAEELQNLSPRAIHEKLLQLSKSYWADGNGQLVAEIDAKMAAADAAELAKWAKERFEADLAVSELEDLDHAKAKLIEVAKEFLRAELGELEKYVLLQIYDSTWKDHLYSMDHLKESIFLRAFAEKDPKIEYKQEGFRMFNEMLEVVEDHVTDTIFKVRLDPGARAQSVWNVSRTQHDEVSQFAMTERQRAAATAPQGERKVKQIRLAQPKVGRNQPCPCGSGKKYKRCCGQNA
jgi:preprotein translocase subunit SecA